MVNTTSFYKILQVDQAAESEIIKAAYRKLAEKYHPDKLSTPHAVARMQEINEAYAVLSNETRRVEYDQELLRLSSSTNNLLEYRTRIMKVKLNFKELETPPDATLDDIIPESTGQIVAQRKSDGNYVVIRREDAENRNVADYTDYITNQTDIIKASPNSDLLIKDLQFFHLEFLHRHPDAEVELVIDDYDQEPQYILINNFPLPYRFKKDDDKMKKYKSSEEDIIICLTGYPNNGPYGIHIRHDSVNRKRIETALDGHVYDEAIGHPSDTSDLESKGWEWLCFHYNKDDEKDWNFNFRDIKRGDCLAKYLINLYAAFCGEFPDE